MPIRQEASHQLYSASTVIEAGGIMSHSQGLVTHLQGHLVKEVRAADPRGFQHEKSSVQCFCSVVSFDTQNAKRTVTKRTPLVSSTTQIAATRMRSSAFCPSSKILLACRALMELVLRP